MAMLRRRFVLVAKVEGDTRHDLADAVRELAARIEREQISQNSICGGPTNSHIASLTEDEAVTQDSHFAGIEAELDQLRQKRVAVLDEVAARR